MLLSLSVSRKNLCQCEFDIKLFHENACSSYSGFSCMGYLGRLDTNRITYVCVVLAKVAKVSSHNYSKKLYFIVLIIRVNTSLKTNLQTNPK
jgi:hypothetical protein